MNRVGGKIILWLLIIGLLIYTATRTLHFLSLTLPPDQTYVAWLALAAFDIGSLGWLYFATSSARGDQQRAISYGMIFVCCAGVVLTTIADTLLGSTKEGLVHGYAWVATVGLWGTIGVITLNVFAGIMAHLADPKHLAHAREETLHAKILAKTHEQMEVRADQIAPRIAARLADHWEDRIVQELTGNLPTRGGGASQLPAPGVRVDQETPEKLPAYQDGYNGSSGKKK